MISKPFILLEISGFWALPVCKLLITIVKEEVFHVPCTISIPQLVEPLEKLWFSRSSQITHSIVAWTTRLRIRPLTVRFLISMECITRTCENESLWSFQPVRLQTNVSQKIKPEKDPANCIPPMGTVVHPSLIITWLATQIHDNVMLSLTLRIVLFAVLCRTVSRQIQTLTRHCVWIERFGWLSTSQCHWVIWECLWAKFTGLS